MDFLTVQSYGSEQESSGTVTVEKWCRTNLTDRHVLLVAFHFPSKPSVTFLLGQVDDICDTGLTLEHVSNALQQNCASVKTVVLLDKTARRTAKVTPDYVGFQVIFDVRSICLA